MNLIFLGGGGHARSLIPEILGFIKTHNITVNILGYTDIKNNGEIYGVKYLGVDDIIYTLSNYKIINCLGSTEKAQIRHNNFLKYKEYIVGFISPKAIISSLDSVGFQNLGLQIMQGAIINSGVNIGANTIINSGAIVEHDVSIGVSCHIAPGAIICGGVKIGNNVHIGAGTTILQELTIANNVIIGAGSVVAKNINETGVYFGNPAIFKKYV